MPLILRRIKHNTKKRLQQTVFQLVKEQLFILASQATGISSNFFDDAKSLEFELGKLLHLDFLLRSIVLAC